MLATPQVARAPEGPWAAVAELGRVSGLGIAGAAVHVARGHKSRAADRAAEEEARATARLQALRGAQ